jgi:hypothetical protein
MSYTERTQNTIVLSKAQREKIKQQFLNILEAENDTTEVSWFAAEESDGKKTSKQRLQNLSRKPLSVLLDECVNV